MTQLKDAWGANLRLIRRFAPYYLCDVDSLGENARRPLQADLGAIRSFYRTCTNRGALSEQAGE